MLLVLDNLEQIAGAGPHVAALLGVVPGLTILATSRVPLNVRGERHWPVPALETPGADARAGRDAIAAFETVQLFVERARDVRPDFRLVDRDAADVAAICRRLDGLPLAIELAAARTKVFEPSNLLARLGKGLALLSGGGQDLPERQRTLRATIAWSWDLLAPPEQTLAALLAVFVGGSTLEAIEALCAGGSEVSDPVEVVSALVDASLLRRSTAVDGSVRFSMLETIREFAGERLEARPDAGDIHRRHAEWVTAFVERAELRGPEMPHWLERTEIEHDNIRAALDWALGEGEAHLARRIVAALWKFWWLRGHAIEGGRFAEAALALSTDLPDEHAGADLAGALNTAAVMIWAGQEQSDALPLLRRSIAIYRRTGPQAELIETMSNLGLALTEVGLADEADALFVECLSLARDAGDDHETVLCLANIAGLSLEREDNDRALRFAREALTKAKTLDDLEVLTAARITLADALDRSSEVTEACSVLALVFEDLARLKSLWHSTVALLVAARAISDIGEPALGARLFAAAETTIRAGRSRIQPAIERDLDYNRRHLLGLLGEEAFEAAYAEGSPVQLEVAVEEARDALSRLAGAAARPRGWR